MEWSVHEFFLDFTNFEKDVSINGNFFMKNRFHEVATTLHEYFIKIELQDVTIVN